MAGFSGTAATTSDEDAWMMSGKSNAGAPSVAMSLKSEEIARPARWTAGQSKDRLCYIGLTIRAGSESRRRKKMSDKLQFVVTPIHDKLKLIGHQTDPLLFLSIVSE